ncbi:MAG: sulfatase, partial [Cyclobacteriaceae bacterium]|nr:sulfatase [Cyclobacteriaceae bacterium]
QGKWKMIPQLGSGGWTKPINVKAEINDPEGQLYDLHADPNESDNLWHKHPEVVEQLQELLQKYKSEGRSVNRNY